MALCACGAAARFLVGCCASVVCPSCLGESCRQCGEEHITHFDALESTGAGGAGDAALCGARPLESLRGDNCFVNARKCLECIVRQWAVAPKSTSRALEDALAAYGFKATSEELSEILQVFVKWLDRSEHTDAGLWRLVCVALRMLCEASHPYGGLGQMAAENSPAARCASHGAVMAIAAKDRDAYEAMQNGETVEDMVRVLSLAMHRLGTRRFPPFSNDEATAWLSTPFFLSITSPMSQR